MSTPTTGAVTVTDVARRAGVSVATAARALGNYGSVSDRSRERVEAAAAELGYRPNMVARSMITKTTQTVGVIVADIENPFFLRALRGITDRLARSGYDVLLANSDEDPAQEYRALQVMAARRVDGLIVTPTEESERDMLAELIDDGLPVVLLDRRLHGLEADSVGLRNRRAAREATQHLLDVGHERIAVITGAGPDRADELHRTDPRGLKRIQATTFGMRTAGYREALAAAGIPFVADYLPTVGFRREDACAATSALMALPRPPTAIITFDSVLTLGALRGLQQTGVRCPDECSLIGFDDAEWTEVVSPPITVMSQPVLQLGERAAERLLQRMNGEPVDVAAIRLSARLVERGSVAPPPSAR
ncbi:MAG: LacI family DNA-binding transcriptional regulator [Nocardioidaceae bacterium]